MIIFKCDCAGCSTDGDKLNRLTIDTVNGDKITYDICSNCLANIQKIIFNANDFKELKTKETEVKQEIDNLKPTKTVKSRVNIAKVIEEYGVDKLKEEYIIKDRLVKEIANELGINRNSLALYLSRSGITKRKAKEKTTSCESKEYN